MSVWNQVLSCRSGIVAIFACLAGCASTQSGLVQSKLVKVAAIDQATGAELQPGTPLRAGHHITAQLKLSAPMYLYAARTRSDGTTQILFESEGALTPESDGTVRIPAQQQGIYLDPGPNPQPLDQFCIRACMHKVSDTARLCHRPDPDCHPALVLDIPH